MSIYMKNGMCCRREEGDIILFFYSVLDELVLQGSTFVFVVLLPIPGFLVLRSLPALSPTSLHKITGFSVIFGKNSVVLTVRSNPGRREFEQVQERPCNFSIITCLFSF